ncbi:XRE family transcriptional regulator [Palleronia sediminis]|uniref:XRE family transcriptional regulator n=1 Tax=Palleronia sediminis TaxID=2547833 RepID=A0A4V3B969_9RHOB|nr:XRE family transcriptional regulator [Palleronia sediminis]TDL78089.1 XRE family transcriptional regulator [Palleronia sediminis]
MSALGADLRALRRARGLTLAQMADRLDRSVGWMSQVERDLSTPDGETLARMAETLDAPLTLLTDREVGEVVRAGRRRVLGERVPGLHEELLSPDLTDGFEVIHSVFQPGARRDDLVIRDTTEIAHLLSGRLSVWLGEDRHDLRPGDTARLRGQPFRWANEHSEPAVAVWIISPAIYTQESLP